MLTIQIPSLSFLCTPSLSLSLSHTHTLSFHPRWDYATHFPLQYDVQSQLSGLKEQRAAVFKVREGRVGEREGVRERYQRMRATESQTERGDCESDKL